MRATTIIIGIIIFSMVAMGFNMFYLDMANNYNVSTDTSSMELLNTLNETYNFTTTAGSSLQGASGKTSQEGISTVDSITTGLNVFWDSIGIIPKMINNVAGLLHLPQWFVIGAIAIILITLIVAILALIGIFQVGGT